MSVKVHLFQYLSLLRANRNVRFLWFSQITSLFGDWFNFIAATELTTTLAHSGTAVSLLVGIRTFAPVLGAPFLPLVAQRGRRRRVLIASDLMRCALVLGLLGVRSPEQLWLLYVLTGLQGFLTGIFFPLRTAILPSLVENEAELGTANALGSLSWTAMVALGTALGGYVTAVLGVAAAFAIDAGTYLASAACLRHLVVKDAPRADASEAVSPFARAVSGFGALWALLRRRPDLLWLALKKTGITMFSFVPTQILQILLSQRYPRIGPSSLVLGFIFGVGGAVSFLSPLVVRMLTGNDHGRMRQAMTWAYLVIVVGMWLQAPVPPFGLLLLGVALRSVGAVIIWTFSTQLLLSLAPAASLESLLSLEYGLWNLTGLVGVALPSFMVEHPRLGLPGAFLVLGGCFLTLALLWGLWLRKGDFVLPAPAGTRR